MTDIIGGFDFKDLGLVAVGNIGSKMLISKFVGDNRLTSGAVKFIGAVGLSMVVRNKDINNVAIGVAVDGIEDLAIGSGLLGGIQGFIGGAREGFEI